MTTDIVLLKLDAARNALTEAKTIQDTKKVYDIATATLIFAKRQKAGREIELQITAFMVDALKQLGDMLKETPRNKGTRAAGGDTGGTIMEPPDNTPTLAEMGLDKKISKLAQDIAVLPEEIFNNVKSGKMTAHEAMKEVRKQEYLQARHDIAQASKDIVPDNRWNIYHADIATWMAPRQYDFIITDPPYPKEYLHLYETLAIKSNEWLKPGGLLIAMCGQSYLNEIYAMMCKHMTYYWTACYLTLHQPTPLRQKNVNTTWKPLLIFTNGDYKGKIFGDVFQSDQNEKDMHDWQQSESGMLAIMKQICFPGQYILDPFCGSGTTGIAAISHGCLFDGIDIDIENVHISKGRISDAAKTRQ